MLKSLFRFLLLRAEEELNEVSTTKASAWATWLATQAYVWSTGLADKLFGAAYTGWLEPDMFLSIGTALVTMVLLGLRDTIAGLNRKF